MKTIESYSPPLKRWHVFNDITEYQLLALVLMDGASVPVGKYRGKISGEIHYQSIDDFFDNEWEAVESYTTEHETFIANTKEEIKEMEKSINDSELILTNLRQRLKNIKS